jgi:hypothetical protein
MPTPLSKTRVPKFEGIKSAEHTLLPLSQAEKDRMRDQWGQETSPTFSRVYWWERMLEGLAIIIILATLP